MITKFSPASFWNVPLAADAALDPDSIALVADLVAQVTQYGPWLNTTAYSAPIYQPAPSTPRQKVTLTKSAPELQNAFAAVPVPAGALAAAGTDQHMVIWDTAGGGNSYWEFWHMRQAADGSWNCAWGGYMDDMQTSPGYFSGVPNVWERNWGATATGLPLLGGMITWNDVMKQTSIDHVLALAIVHGAKGFVAPAHRTDGNADGLSIIKAGQRFRVDPAFDCATLTHPFVATLARAAQKYGLVVRDHAGAVCLFGKDPKTMPSNPFPALLAGTMTGVAMRTFPWTHLLALPPLP